MQRMSGSRHPDILNLALDCTKAMASERPSAIEILRKLDVIGKNDKVLPLCTIDINYVKYLLISYQILIPCLTSGLLCVGSHTNLNAYDLSISNLYYLKYLFYSNFNIVCLSKKLVISKNLNFVT